MRWLVWRELLVVTRVAAFWLATATYLLAITAYILIWGDGIPVTGAAPPWQQFLAVQTAVLLVVLPWAAARCGTTHRSDLTLIACLTAASPSRVVLARCLAHTAALFLLSISALPLAVVMQQLTASTWASLAAIVPMLTALSIFAAAATTGALLAFANPLRAWIAATAVAVVAGRVLAVNAAAWFAVAIVLAFAATMAADRRLTYLAGGDIA